MMFHFCELDAAARMRPRAAAAAPPPPRAPGSADGAAAQLPAGQQGSPGSAPGRSSSAQLSPQHSYAPSWSGSEASELLFGADSASVSSSLAAGGSSAALGDSPARPAPHRHSLGHHQHATPPRPPPPPRSDSLSDGSGRQASMLPAASLPPPSGTAAGLLGGAQLRMALPVNQRGATKAALRQLHDQLATAQADLAGARRAARACRMLGCQTALGRRGRMRLRAGVCRDPLQALLACAARCAVLFVRVTAPALMPAPPCVACRRGAHHCR